MKYKFLFSVLFLAFFIFSCKNTLYKSTTINPNHCTEYACPMHPDHTSTVPAKCPECNMEMDSVGVSADARKDSTLAR